MLLFYQSLQKGGFLNQEGEQSIILLWLDDCGEKDIPQLKWDEERNEAAIVFVR